MTKTRETTREIESTTHYTINIQWVHLYTFACNYDTNEHEGGNKEKWSKRERHADERTKTTS